MKLPSSQNLNFILIPLCGLLLFLLLHKSCGNKCPEQAIYSQTIHDTTYVKREPVMINVPAPLPKRISAVIDTQVVFAFADDSSYSPYAQGYKDATEALMKLRGTCRDTAFYNDTITSKDNWRLILLESITGNRIINRKPFVEDLRPVITTTISTQLPRPTERIRFYGGTDLTINTNYLNRWGIDIAGILTLPQGYAIRYAYDLHNNAHTVGFYALVRLKR